MKIDINFQSETKQQHDTSNEIETYTGNSKAGKSLMSSCHLQAEHPLEINSKLVVTGHQSTGQQPEKTEFLQCQLETEYRQEIYSKLVVRKEKNRSIGQILKLEINFQPLSQIISRLGTRRAPLWTDS